MCSGFCRSYDGKPLWLQGCITLQLLSPCRLETWPRKLWAYTRFLHFPVSTSGFCLPLSLFCLEAALISVADLCPCFRASCDAAAFCVCFCPVEFCFCPVFLFCAAALEASVQSSWRQPALMAPRGFMECSECTWHICRAGNCFRSVTFHSGHNSDGTVLELCAYCTAPLHPWLCSSVPFRPGSIQFQQQSRSSQWPRLTAPGTRAGAALPCPGPMLQHSRQLSCDWSRNRVAGDELWRAQGALEWLLSIAEMDWSCCGSNEGLLLLPSCCLHSRWCYLQNLMGRTSGMETSCFKGHLERGSKGIYTNDAMTTRC